MTTQIRQIKPHKAQTQSEEFSDLLYAFCRPLLAVQNELGGPENAIRLAVFSWNAAFLDTKRLKQRLAEALTRLALTDDVRASLMNIVEEMVRQKHLLHPGYWRVIVSHEIKIVGGAIQLSAACRESEAFKKNTPQYPHAANASDCQWLVMDMPPASAGLTCAIFSAGAMLYSGARTNVKRSFRNASKPWVRPLHLPNTQRMPKSFARMPS